MSETPGQVFEALLAEWRSSESQIISEWGTAFRAEEAEADREMGKWRRRFDQAEARFVEALKS